MHEIFAFIIFCLISISAKSQGKIVAEISNIRNDKGVCRLCLFNSPTAFQGEGGKPFMCESVVVKNNTARTVLNVPSGAYALFVFHDANSNNKMDKNFIGIPKEGYGASKNKLPFAGAPTYNENKFVVEDKTSVTLQIKLRNL